MEVFKYKNYAGSIETDAVRACLRGKILLIKDLVTYEAQTMAELKKEFEAAVDDYLSTCAQMNKEPDKPCLAGLNDHTMHVDHRVVHSEGGAPTDSTESDEMKQWDQMAAVGREFGSPDFERLEQEAAAKFVADMKAWIAESEKFIAKADLNEDMLKDAINIQIALRELGQEVSLMVAASVWINYSQSMKSDWMPGAATVNSARRILFLNCPKR